MKVCWCWLLVCPVLAQAPNTDIFLADLNSGNTDWSVSNVRNITDREGYDNQPLFRDNQRILFTSLRGEGETANTDIFQFDLDSGQTSRLTHTPESEYSPTPTPDGAHFSTIRVEADGTQRLWQFPFDGGDPSLVLPDVKPVGYHLWIDQKRLALFVLGEPNTLQIVTIGEQPRVLMPDVGRCFQKIPGQNAFSVVQKPRNKPWVLKRFDSKTLQSEDFIAVKEGAEDYAWTPSGHVLMASGTQLFRWNPGQQTDWVLVTDLEAHGLKQITRMAVSPDGRHLAMVAQP